MKIKNSISFDSYKLGMGGGYCKNLDSCNTDEREAVTARVVTSLG